MTRTSKGGVGTAADSLDRIPLNAGQRALWSQWRAWPERVGYNTLVSIPLPSSRERAVAARVVAALHRRWPILGAHVVLEGGAPQFVPNPEGEPLAEVDGRGWTEAETEAWLSARVTLPIDMDRGPLMRPALLDGAEGSTLHLTIHHIVIDGGSYARLLGEVRDLTETLLADGAPPPAVSPKGYHAHLERETKAMEGKEGERRRAHWAAELADLPEAPDLAPGQTRAEAPSPFAANTVIDYPMALHGRLEAFARDQGLTTPMVMLGVWQALLARLAGVEDLVVGMPVNRHTAKVGHLTGLFIDMLPLRARDLDKPALDCLTALGKRARAGLRRLLPLPVLAHVAEAEDRPLVHAGFYYQDFFEPSPWDPPAYYRQSAEYDLVLEVKVLPDRVVPTLIHDPALHDVASARGILTRYVTLLDGLLASPETPLSELSLLGAAERVELLDTRNATDRLYVLDPLPELIARQVARVPEAPAVSGPERSFTYAELDRLSAGLTRRLIAKGVTKGATVGLCLDRTPWMVVGLLGILRAGAAYVPLDPAYPRERLDYMLSDAGAQVVVGDGSGPFSDVMPVDGPIPEETTPLPSLDGEDLAYILYTSGSTGNPKGVMIPHRALSNFLQSMAEDLSMTERDRLLAVTTVCFDIAGLELFLPLTLGAEVIVCPAEVAKDGRGLKEHLAKLRPTVMQATPATWTMLFHAGWTNAEGLKVLCGGEALPASLKAKFDGVKTPVWNLFGPTETTIWSTVARLGPGDPITIGKPLANTRIYVLDGKGQPVPEGVAGELYIGGSGVALGYRNLPERTDLVFRPDPFHGGMMYNTGDLARWRSDGSLDYLGRADQQVKIRGYRVEPGEIEARLDSHPTVSRSAVVAQATAHGARLVAWVVPGAGARIEVEALKAHLSQTLPPYMVPEVYSTLEALPLTNNNKVDRKTLMAREPVLVQAKPSARRKGEASRMEARLTALWEEVLAVKGIGPTDRFFSLGGDSVSAVLLTEKLAKTLDRSVRVTDLFRHPTIRGLAGYLSEMNEEPPMSRTTTFEDAQATPGIGEGADGLAIIGISCRFPGADDHWTFWENLKAGRDPAKWFSRAELLDLGLTPEAAADPALVPVQRAIDGKGDFDGGFFGLAPRTAELMDPQARLLLQASWAALEDAGYTPDDMADTAVFMGAAMGSYQARLQDPAAVPENDQYTAWLLSQPGTLATAISFHLGLTGPSLFVQTNCSTFLTALAQADRCLRAGDAPAALVGACTLFPDATPGYRHRAFMNFSSDGLCKAFDAKADGMVAGEGGGAILVKRASQAVADGDHIYAVIKGVGLSNDGADKAGFHAPGVAGQARAITQALRAAKVDPASIGYVEAHGTGTALGDPIEVAALTEAWAPLSSPRAAPCVIGSVKSNIGHLDTAAGLAGCVKAALSLYHGEIPPTLHFTAPNPKIDFASVPFEVAGEGHPWPAIDGPRRAAVSAFGIGGTNGHAILEEAPARAEAGEPGEIEHLLMLSARGPERLRALAASLVEALDHRPVALADLTRTLRRGRVAQPHRLAHWVEDLEEAKAVLRQVAEGRLGATPRWSFDGESPFDDEAGRELVAAWATRGEWAKVGSAWMSGATLDWEALDRAAAAQGRRVSLPPYPFAKDRHWLAPAQVAPVSESPDTPISAPKPLAAKPLDASGWDGLCHGVTWGPAPLEGSKGSGLVAGKVLLLASPSVREVAEDAIRAWAASRPDLSPVRVILGEDVGRDGAAFDGLLGNHPDARAVVFLEGEEAEEETLAAFTRSLRSTLGKGDRLDLFVVGLDRFPQDGTTPVRSSGLSGLCLSIAQSDERIQTRCLDLPAAELADTEMASALWTGVLDEPLDRRGAVTRLEAGERLRQIFPRMLWGEGASSTAAIRSGGHYVILGGSGWLGRILTRHLVETHGAKVSWVGRRAATDPLLAQWSRSHGVTQARADVTDGSALEAALDGLEAKAGPIHGVFFLIKNPAVLDGIETGLDALSRLKPGQVAGYAASKVDGMAATLEATRDRALDFLCVFTSIQAFGFLGARETAAYASAIARSDGLARAARAGRGHPIGLIHWGHWPEERDPDGVEWNKVLAPLFQTITTPEGMGALDRFLGALVDGSLDTVVCLNASDALRQVMPAPSDWGWRPVADGPRAPSVLAELDTDAMEANPPIPEWGEAMDWIRPILRAQLRQLGLFTEELEEHTDALRHRLGVIDDYRRWWDECVMGVLDGHGVTLLDGGRVRVDRTITEQEAREAWAGWDRVSAPLRDDPSRGPAVRLLDDCMRRMPEVLSGKVKATEVIFPNGSFHKIAGLYKGTPWTDSFNLQIADAVEALVARRRARGEEPKLRILEIGAGTGGTTVKVMDRLAALGHPMEEYRFTDLSAAFLIEARRRWEAEHPYLRATRCDIERPLADQGIELGSYDVVISTNCLHATRDMRRTLTHARTALKPGGLLMVNEAVRKGMRDTLIFGLLEGWWLSEDAHLRIPGSPMLTTERWVQLLRDRGFPHVVALKGPGRDHQVVLLAEARGPLVTPFEPTAKTAPVVPKGAAGPEPVATVAPAPAPTPAPAPAPVSVPAPAPVVVAAPAASSGLAEQLLACLAETLLAEPDQVDMRARFVDMGVDSILGVTFVERLNKTLGLGLEPAVVFDHPTPEGLVAHLAGLIPQGAPVSAPAPAPTPTPVPAPKAEVVPLVQPGPEPEPVAEPTAVPAPVDGALGDGVRACLAEVLLMQPEDLSLEDRFADLGVDSILGVTFVQNLNKAMGLDLATSVFFDHPTLADMTAYLAGQGAGGEGRVEATVEVAPTVTTPEADDPILAALEDLQRGAAR